MPIFLGKRRSLKLPRNRWLAKSKTPTAALTATSSDGLVFGDSDSSIAKLVPITATDGLKFSEDFTIGLIIDSGPEGLKLGDSPVGVIKRYVQQDGLKFGDAPVGSFPGSAKTASDGLKFGDGPSAIVKLAAIRDGLVFSDANISSGGVSQGGADELDQIDDLISLTGIT